MDDDKKIYEGFDENYKENSMLRDGVYHLENNVNPEGKPDAYDLQEQKNQQYQDYIDEITPKHNMAGQIIRSFITGGIICILGQFIIHMGIGRFGLETEDAGTWCSIVLVLIADILTGFGIYPKLVKWGGAGMLVPITGFANSISSSAIEYKKEGWVFGVGCKIFTIAGPVILYGIFISWILGLIYWLIQRFQIF